MYLTFSDSAKFADIARNLLNGLGYGEKFNFWSVATFTVAKDKLFPSFSIPPVMPYSIALFFKLFGVSDFSVILTSIFYFVLTLIFVYLLSQKIFRNTLVSVLSTIAVGFDYDLINYATDGASEAPFIFEIVAAAYFISIKKWWGTAIALLLLVSMYLTRPQAFIYMVGLILFYLLDRFKIKNAILLFLGIILLGLWVDRNVLFNYTGFSFLYSITERGSSAVGQFSAGAAVSDSLRGSGVVSTATASAIITPNAVSSQLPIFKKIFYNIYNFYKLLPQIMSPYLFALFVVGLFRWTKNRIYNSLKFATVFMFLLTLLVTALSIPFFRYIHPAVPLIYVFSVETLVWIIGKIFFNKRVIVLASTFLILFLAVGQTLGVLLLDSRFEKDTHNVGKTPEYILLSQILKENTSPSQVIVTNLDTWGTWYGERKTVWFPIEPKQLIDPATGKISFDAIYLTSYLIDDQNYYMGSDWREIFNNPDDSSKWICDGCKEIAKEFKLKEVYNVSSNADYERQDAKAVLLVKDN